VYSILVNMNEEREERKEEEKRMTFAEIAEIVQAGGIPPGIVKVEERPSGTESVKSEVERPKKPWEREQLSEFT
jgi:hypothetical protein